MVSFYWYQRICESWQIRIYRVEKVQSLRSVRNDISFTSWIYWRPHSAWIHEKRIAGLRTVQFSWRLQQQLSLLRLTHFDNIRVCVVHLNIVFLCPLQANFYPGLEHHMLFCKFFPFCHKHLKTGDGTRQNWCGFKWHALLTRMRNLSSHKYLPVCELKYVTYTQDTVSAHPDGTLTPIPGSDSRPLARQGTASQCRLLRLIRGWGLW